MSDQSAPHAPKPARWLVPAAFAIIYVIWSSSYLAIHYAIQTIPPFYMAAMRFAGAGAALYLWMRWRGVPRPSRRQWIGASVAGFLFFAVNNGALVWAEQFVPTGTAALIIGTTPIFMALFDWWRPGGHRPRAIVFLGLALGVVGVALLVNPSARATLPVAHQSEAPSIWLAYAAVFGGAIAWAAGSIYNRHTDLPENTWMSTALQLFTGGVMLAALGLVTGETARFNVAAISPLSILSVVYLATFSSLLAFGSYVWLLKVSTPARVATYAYVNPVIAVFLGWALAGEAVSERTLLAAVVIIAAVMVINSARIRSGAARAMRGAAVPESPEP